MIDQGPFPHQTPTGLVALQSTTRGLSILLNGPGVFDPARGGLECSVAPLDSIGAAGCSFELHPAGLFAIKEGERVAVLGTYFDPTNAFDTANATFLARYTPTLDPSNKITAARAEAHLLAIAGASAAIAYKVPPAAVVAIPTGITAGLLATPFHYLQLPDEPPDPRYAEVYQPLIHHAAARGSTGLAHAERALRQTDLEIEGWAGAEWNALNRSVVARLKNNRAAFVTQMLAASTDEKMLAGLVVKLPRELAAIQHLFPKSIQNASVRLNGSDLRKIKYQLTHPSRAQQRFDKSVGLAPALVESLIASTTRHLTRAGLGGGVFANLRAAVAQEAGVAPFLRRVAAIHAAMASLYS